MNKLEAEVYERKMDELGMDEDQDEEEDMEANMEKALEEAVKEEVSNKEDKIIED